MSGVRFISIVMAIGASFLWGGFVVNTWYKNGLQKNAKLESPSQEHLAKNTDLTVSTKKATQKKQEEKIVAVDETLQHADALALAASEEFNIASEKINKLMAPDDENHLSAKERIAERNKTKTDKTETNKEPIKLAMAKEQPADQKQKPKKTAPKSKPVWVVPDGATPQYTIKPIKKVAPVKEVAASKTIKEKPVWVVPDGVTPEYDEFTAIKVGSIPWQIPTANDPIEVNPVKAKINEIATGVKDSASVAAEKVSEKLSSIANEVKETIEGDSKWVVPTGAQPSYKERDYVKDEGAPIWSVPDGITPSYAHRDEPIEKIKSDPANKTVLAKLKHKLANKKMAVAETTPPQEIIKNKIENRLGDGDVQGDGEPTSRRPQINQDKDGTRLASDQKIVSKLNEDNQSKKINQDTHKSATENKNDKSEKTRLADAKNAKPMVDDNPKSAKQDKEKSLNKTKDNAKSTETKVASKTKETVKSKPVWVVPTGADPQVSVVAKLERGLESVKQAAEDAGTKIAQKVTSLGSNVKEAVASTKKWEVPTGKNWNDGEPNKELSFEKTKQTQQDNTVTKEVAKELALKKADAKPKAEQTAQKIAKQDTAEKALAEKKAYKPSKDAQARNQEEEVSKQVSKDNAMPLPIKKQIILAALPKKKDAQIPEAKTVIEAPAAKKGIEEKREIFVSSKMNPIGEEVKVAAKEGEESGEKKTITPKKVYNRILEIIDEVKNGKNNKKADPNKVSGLDKARFAALKVLMVDNVNYKFTDIKKGEGEIKINGRSQSGSKLALYIGEHLYLGNVVANDKGEWSFEKSLYLPQGAHVVQAQQMSKSGLVLAKKTMPLKQTIAARPPKGYEPGIGIDLGDKALKVMKDKLKEEDLPKRKLASKEPASSDKTIDKDAAIKDLKAKDQKAKKVAKAEQKPEHVKKETKLKEAPLIKEAALKIKPEEKTGKPEKAGKQDKASKDEQAQKTIYVVQRGDTVKKIAKKLYGDSDRYNEIVRLNPNLPKNNMIHPNQKLIISAKGEGLDKGGLDEKDVALAAKETKTKETKVAKLENKNADKVKPKEEGKTKEANTIPVPKQNITTYTVRQGDTLTKIAQKIYGEASRYKEIFKLNPKLKKNGLIHPKQRLIVQATGASDKKQKSVKVAALKTKQELKKAHNSKKTDAKKSDPEKAGQQAKTTKEPDSAAGAEFYKVKSGDNLWTIAKKVYGNGAQFNQIIKLNPQLVKNPKLIQPNVKLRVRSAAS